MIFRPEGIKAQALKNRICILLKLNWDKFNLKWNMFGLLNSIPIVINIKQINSIYKKNEKFKPFAVKIQLNKIAIEKMRDQML